jgi:translation initiation factor IF-3
VGGEIVDFQLNSLCFLLDLPRYVNHWMRSIFLLCKPLVRTASSLRFQRCFTTTPRLRVDSRRVAGVLEIRTIDDKLAELNLNERISSPWVRTKTPEGAVSDPQRLSDLLASINRGKQYVMRLNREEDPIAIVKIVTRLELIQQMHKHEDTLRNQKRLEKEKRPKQIELNWAISGNDLSLKMKQMHEFLAKGKKVEILMANKRHARKATPEEAKALLKAVRAKIEEIDAQEITSMDGAILKQATLTVKMRESVKVSQ